MERLGYERRQRGNQTKSYGYIYAGTAYVDRSFILLTTEPQLTQEEIDGIKNLNSSLEIYELRKL